MTTKTETQEFVIERVFDAPIDLVFKCWTEPERMKKWFTPKGFENLSVKQELRPGGVYHYGMKGPDGKEMWGKCIYREIKAPERLVYVQYFSDAKQGVTRHPMSPTWPLEMLTTILLEAQGKKTKVTVKWLPINATEEERKTFDAARSGMSGGWTGTFEQLAAYLKALPAS